MSKRASVGARRLLPTDSESIRGHSGTDRTWDITWDAFSVEAWVALNTLPWNWVPIIDHEQFQQVGYSFGIDAFGHVGLQVSVNGVWQSRTRRLSRH